MNTADDNVEDDLSLNEDIAEVPDDAVQQEHTSPEKQSEASSEVLLEFLEVAVHQILYLRRLYPEEIFLPRKKYNVPVRTSSHPGLNRYISSSLSSLKKLLRENRICNVSVLILDGSKPLENFVFELKILRDQLNTGQDFIELEQGLRSFMLKILSSTQSLNTVPETCSFEILVGSSSDCEVDLNITGKDSTARWSVVDKGDFTSSLKPKSLIPVKALTEAPGLKLQLVIEQMDQSMES